MIGGRGSRNTALEFRRRNEFLLRQIGETWWRAGFVLTPVA